MSHYEGLKVISYILESKEFHELSRRGIDDIKIKYGYLDPEKPTPDNMWVHAKVKDESETGKKQDDGTD